MLANNYAECSRNKNIAHISIQFLFASVITIINRRNAMNARKDFTEYEAVLKYCCIKTKNNHEQAVHYGQLSGYFTTDNKLTPMGRRIAQYIED